MPEIMRLQLGHADQPTAIGIEECPSCFNGASWQARCSSPSQRGRNSLRFAKTVYQ